MDEARAPIGSAITLAELKGLGEFVRWQDVEPRVAELVAAKRLPNGYPIVASRLSTNGIVDLFDHERWLQVRFVRLAGSPMGGDHRIVYVDGGQEKSRRYDRYAVAPAGHFTEWNGPRPESLAEAQLLGTFELAQHGHVIHSQKVVAEDWPYITIEARSFHPDARWVDRDDMWLGTYTVHAADPRVSVPGVLPGEPWFNTTIAVSHRWLRPDHPDPGGVQYRDLLEVAERLGLHDNQAFLIDYCSLPQQPRTPDESAWFREQLPGFQTQFKYVTVVLNTGSADYSTRAWCMLELMLSAMNSASRTLILNHEQLDAPLREAKELAREYVKTSVWNQEAMLGTFRGGLTMATFGKWSRDAMNVALYNASIDGRRKVRDKFERELQVTDPNDRPIIMDLLSRLAFNDSSG